MLGRRRVKLVGKGCHGHLPGYNVVQNLRNLVFSAIGGDFRHLREHIEEIFFLAAEVRFDEVCRTGFHVKLTLKVVMNEVDLHIGSRLRGRRLLFRWSIEAVARLAGVDGETMTAFEEGQQRVSATDMIRLCEILDMRPLDIFRGYPYAEDPDEIVGGLRIATAADDPSTESPA